MKKSIKRNVIVNLTIDSSEMIMFTKGGMHKVDMNLKDIFPERFGSVYDLDETDSNDDFIITIQLERDEQGRFDWITGATQDTKNNWDTQEKKDG